MIYMVEMALGPGEPEDEWHAWYDGHIRKLLRVPGFRASQRFRSLLPTLAPFTALHEVEAGVHESAAYRAVGGPGNTGRWQHLMPNWRRNLLAGLEETPEVGEGACLLVIDGPREIAAPVTWTAAVGLDRSPTARGLGVIAEREVAEWTDVARSDPGVRVYRPLSGKLRSLVDARSGP